MKRSSFEPVRLVIQASDPGTEIFVVDGRLKRIASGVGALEVDVPPGLYKIRLRSGGSQRDEFLSVEPGAGEVIFHAEPVAFRSAAPLELTRTTHEYHSHPAADLSRGQAMDRGTGSGLFLFLREEDRDAPSLHVESVSIHDLAGDPIAELKEGEVEEQWGWAGLNLALDPGTYRIRVDTGPLGSYDLFVTMAQGWQTQAFLITEDFFKTAGGEIEGSKVRRPSLRLASLLMAPMGAGFDPSRADSRLSELARQALAQGRPAMNKKDMENLLHDKFHDPLLGIYAAHLLLLERRIRWSLLDHVCHNLFGLVGPHPDVQALFLRLQEESSSMPRVEELHGVPTLRRSWDLIVRASRRRPSLVPRGSILATVAEDMASAQPYLLYRVGRDTPADASAAVTPVSRAKAVKQAVGWVVEERGRPSEILARLRSEGLALSSLERALLGTVIASAPGMGAPEGVGVEGEETHAGEEAEWEEYVLGHEKDIRLRLTKALNAVNAPPSAVSGSLASLVEKLEAP